MLIENVFDFKKVSLQEAFFIACMRGDEILLSKCFKEGFKPTTDEFKKGMIAIVQNAGRYAGDWFRNSAKCAEILYQKGFRETDEYSILNHIYSHTILATKSGYLHDGVGSDVPDLVIFALKHGSKLKESKKKYFMNRFRFLSEEDFERYSQDGKEYLEQDLENRRLNDENKKRKNLREKLRNATSSKEKNDIIQFLTKNSGIRKKKADKLRDLRIARDEYLQIRSGLKNRSRTSKEKE